MAENNPQPQQQVRKRLDIEGLWEGIALLVGVVALLALVFGVVPALIAATLASFLPHFPVGAVFSGWAALVLIIGLVYLAWYWLHEEPEEEPMARRLPVVSIPPKHMRRE